MTFLCDEAAARCSNVFMLGVVRTSIRSDLASIVGIVVLSLHLNVPYGQRTDNRENRRRPALAGLLRESVVWAGIITAGSIRSSTMGCLRALVKRAQEGAFAPERALRIAQARKVQQRVVSAPIAVPDLGPIDEDNALPRPVRA